jgi:F-type H+-transporting ATPase subunit a
MILVALILFWMFRSAAKKYKDNPNVAPSGMQGLLEPMFLFVRDEVAIPFIGEKKYKKFFPFLLSLFFFILGLNLFGQIPFLGSINATGNLTLTMVLAIIAFIVTNINGNKDYWKHIFWMPGVPTFVKPLLAGVEGMGLFIKPLTLMLRLAGNISAGHIAILSFVGLIFIFGDLFGSMGNGIGTALAIPLTLFMMAIELIVAFIQAFVFTMLTASYIGAATEEHDHH